MPNNISSAYQTAKLQLQTPPQLKSPTGPLTTAPATTAPKTDTARQKALTSQGTTQLQADLTAPKTKEAFGQKLSKESPSSLTSRAERLSGTLSQTSLGKELGQLQSSAKGLSAMSKDLTQVMKGQPTTATLQSGSRVLAKGGALCGHPEVAAVTGKVLAPLAMIDSGSRTMDACRRAWDKPSAHNLAVAGKQSLKLMHDTQTTLEMVPGGAAVTTGVGSLVSGFVPGAATLALIPKIDHYSDVVKATKANPSAKNIANLTLETAKLGCAGLAATNVPGLAQIGAVAELGIDVVQKIVNIDYKKVGRTIASWFS